MKSKSGKIASKSVKNINVPDVPGSRNEEKMRERVAAQIFLIKI